MVPGPEPTAETHGQAPYHLACSAPPGFAWGLSATWHAFRSRLPIQRTGPLPGCYATGIV